MNRSMEKQLRKIKRFWRWYDAGKFWVTLPWGGLVATWGLDPSGYDVSNEERQAAAFFLPLHGPGWVL